MKKFLQVAVAALALAAPSLALAQEANLKAPESATAEQLRMINDWGKYSVACQGDVQYCGAASYIDFRLQEEGLCYDFDLNGFKECDPAAAKDPLKDYPF